MRLLFVARRYWPAVGGVESFLRDVSRELGARHQVTVLAQRIDDGPTERLSDSLMPPPTFAPFDDGPVRVEPLRLTLLRRAVLAPLVYQVTPVLRRYAYGRSRRLAAALYARDVAPVIANAGGNVDVLHMWGHDLVATAAVRASASLAVPVVVTPFAHRGQWGDDPASLSAYRGATRIVALLGTDAEFYRELGVPEERILVGGVCTAGVQPGGGPDARARLQIDGPLVLFLGVRRAYKGYDLLLEAAQLVGRMRGDVTFAFVGSGPPVDGVPGVRIIDAGSVSDEERATWIDAADLLCLPSQGEILPVSILEAWSVGTPVLTSDIPPLVELVETAHGGAVAPHEPVALASAILELLSDRSRLQELGANGQRAWRERYTVAAVATWHEQLYASLVERRSRECAA